MGEEATDGLVWTLEAVRFPEPVTRWSSALYTTLQTEIIARAHGRDGRPPRRPGLRGSWTGDLHRGGAIRGAGPHRPRWLIPILCRARPDLRRRLAAAHAADVTDWSGQIVDEWQRDKETDLLERGRGYLAGDLGCPVRRAGGGAAGGAAALRRGVLHLALPAPGRRGGRHRPAGVGAHPPARLERPRAAGPLHGALVAPPRIRPRRSGPSSPRARRPRRLDSDAATLADVAAISPAVAAALQEYQDLWGSGPSATRWPTRPSSSGRSGCSASSRTRPRTGRRRGRGGPQRGHPDRGRGPSHRHARQQLAHPPPAGPGPAGVPTPGRQRARPPSGSPWRAAPSRAPCRLPARPVPSRGRLRPHVRRGAGGAAPPRACLARTDAARSPSSRREERERMGAKAPPPCSVTPADRVGLDRPDLRGYPRAAAEQLAALVWYTEQVTAPLAKAGWPTRSSAASASRRASTRARPGSCATRTTSNASSRAT